MASFTVGVIIRVFSPARTAVVALVAVLLTLLTAVPSLAATAETEPNNTTAAATVVPLGTTVSGSALSASSYDTDYYAVDLPRAGRVRLDFKFPAGLGTSSVYTLSVYN
ncbi:hypothetical protein, partial [Arthrobacter sp. C9C5]|uniref:hypothetical protein n=1 Tax=Arthrobacter sp. C9C5 TaxID=2735267 RepID=UPI001C30FC3B